MRSVIAVYVENKYGVLTRVAGLFMRRGFNIDSLTVGETEDHDYSRITIALNGDEYIREQLINQLNKLHNVKKVKLLDNEGSVERELMIMKVKNTPETRSEIMAAAEVKERVRSRRRRTFFMPLIHLARCSEPTSMIFSSR